MPQALHAVTRFIWILLKMWFFETFSRILASRLISSGWNFVFRSNLAQSLFKTGQDFKKYQKFHWKMHEHVSESIEPPTNPQFLNSSGHVKWSLHNLRNIRNGKFRIILGGKYLVIHMQVPSWHPQQHICHLQKSEPSLYDSLTNILHFIKRRHPQQTTGSKDPEFRGKNSPFWPLCMDFDFIRN